MNKETITKYSTFISFTIFAAALIYGISKVLLPVEMAVDFRYFWLAGSLWSEGITPYGSHYVEFARETFLIGNIPPQWAYPPHFRPVAELLAMVPVDISAYAWRLFGLVSVVAGVAFLFMSSRLWYKFDYSIVMAVMSFALTMQATAFSISIGQSSPLIFLGYTMLVYGYLSGRKVIVGLALVVLMFKPTYGLIPSLFILAHPQYLKTIVMSALITLAFSVWGLWGADLNLFVTDIIEAFESYKNNPVNSAPAMTGLRHVAYMFGFGETSQLFYVALGGVFSFIIGLLTRNRSIESLGRVYVIVFIGFLFLVFSPLHTYDGYFVLAVAVPAFALGRVERSICIVFAFFLWRSGNLANITGIIHPGSVYFPGSTIESFSSLICLILFSVLTLIRLSARQVWS